MNISINRILFILIFIYKIQNFWNIHTRKYFSCSFNIYPYGIFNKFYRINIFIHYIFFCNLNFFIYF